MTAERRALVLAGVLIGAAASSCGDDEEEYHHASEHEEGHDHHEEGHGHGGMPQVRFTIWSDDYEVFGEHTPAVVGEEVDVLLHITALDGFRPRERGAVRLELDGPAEIRGRAAAPHHRGMYRLRLTPTSPGRYRGRVVIEGSEPSIVDGVEITVAASDAEATRGSDEDDQGLIELLKEQQWGVPFGTAFASDGSLVPTVEVAGTVETPPGGTAEVGAPVAGRLVAPAAGLPRPGQQVQRGQVLATLVPAPASPEGAARATLAVAEAEARASAAELARERAERLIADEAISTRELEDARREEQVAGEAVRAARQARELFSGTGPGGASAWRLTAPIAGTLVSVQATPGAALSAGDVLFRIVDARELWIRARVPEQDAAHLRADRDAHYVVSGSDDWRTIHVTGDDATASVVSIARIVDPDTRTVDVIYALNAPDETLRVGGLLEVGLPAGDDFSGIVVPRSAVVVDDGREVVYVQEDGEHFRERAVRTAARAGEMIGIADGLHAGERIVVRGAHVVRLADRSRSAAPHGHIH